MPMPVCHLTRAANEGSGVDDLCSDQSADMLADDFGMVHAGSSRRRDRHAEGRGWWPVAAPDGSTLCLSHQMRAGIAPWSEQGIEQKRDTMKEGRRWGLESEADRTTEVESSAVRWMKRPLSIIAS